MNRRGMIDALAIERQQVRPGTRLEAIVPRANRRETWRRVQDAMDLELPKLRHPGPVVVALPALGVVDMMGAGIALGTGLGAMAVLFFLGLVAGGFGLKISPALAVAFPYQVATAGDEAWETLCRVIVRQTGVDREMIKPDAHIVDDLGVD
jgi:hypothetical protein